MPELILVILIVLVIIQGLRGKLKPGQRTPTKKIVKFSAPPVDDQSDRMQRESACLVALEDFLRDDPETGKQLMDDLVLSDYNPHWIQFHAPPLFDIFEENGFGKNTSSSLKTGMYSTGRNVQ